jgi:hypothetical protein
MLLANNTVYIKTAVKRILNRLRSGKFFLSSLSVCLACSAAIAQDNSNPSVAVSDERAAIEIIALQNRDPAYVRAVIQPSLDPRGSIAQVDNKLIIATTAGNLFQLKVLIEQTDLPAQRLVLSVDFDHSDTPSSVFNVVSAAQQSVQAIEGDTVLFSSAVSAASVPQLSVRAIIQNEMADTEVGITNVPGFTGLHRIQLALGEWYILNPQESPEEELRPMLIAEMPELAQESLADPLSLIGDSVLPPVAETQVTPSRQPPIAVRVDVLP